MRHPDVLAPQLRFSHIGFFVRNIDQQAVFYKEVLGFTETDRGTLPTPSGEARLVFLSRDPDEHHQIVLVSGRPSEQHFNVINQISLKAASLEGLQALHRELQRRKVGELIAVTHGNAVSVYFRDPEGNRIELYVDTPWYVSQPCRVEVPIDLPADELFAWIEAHARGLEGFRPRAQWRAEMAARMGLTP
ncbi:VOC family protein [Ottowia sp. VDI28]|uniref:VOC family protein n=1 Tax=Ottowia sp. VDI28 TaxID=3133968 RepID=UPI003C2B3283